MQPEQRREHISKIHGFLLWIDRIRFYFTRFYLCRKRNHEVWSAAIIPQGTLLDHNWDKNAISVTFCKTCMKIVRFL